MSNEYKEINRAIVQQNGIDNNINRGNLLREIDEVYALAEKLPEYEAKAKAFDAYHGTIQSHLHLKGEPEFSNPATEVLSDLIDIHDDYENKGDK